MFRAQPRFSTRPRRRGAVFRMLAATALAGALCAPTALAQAPDANGGTNTGGLDTGGRDTGGLDTSAGDAGARALSDQPALERLLAPADGTAGSGRLGAYEARALIEPRAEAILSSEIGGRIMDLPVDAGERFAKGDVLVAFDCSFHQAELRAARAELTRAARTLDNKEQLARLNSIGQLDVALARADVDKARAQVQTRQLYVNRCRLTAPYDGWVVERPVNAHETVGKDQELMSVIAEGGLKVRLIVPSRWLAWLESGQRFDLTIDETGGSHAAEVTTIGARIDPVSQTLPLEGRLLDTETQAPRLLPGMSGTARFDPPGG